MTKIVLSRLLGVLVVACLAVGASAPAHALDKVKMVIPRNSVFVLNYFGARDAGIFKKYGIDLEIDARPFAGFLAGIPSKEAMVGTLSGMSVISHINHGMDLVVIGGGLTVVQNIYVLAKSPIHSIGDLRGKIFGTWSTGAGAFKALRAVLLDGYHFDVTKDDNLKQLGAPALFKLLQRGQVDAMLNISSLTIAAASQPSKYRSIFSPNEFWRKKTGYPIVWTAPLVAWRSWVEANPDRAKRVVEATHASFRWLRDPKHLHAAVKKYGELAAVRTATEERTYARWLKEKRFFLAHWDKAAVDAEWKFLDVAKKYGVIDKVPPKDKYAMVLH